MIPSLKSSPLQRVVLRQEEDYCDIEDDGQPLGTEHPHRMFTVDDGEQVRSPPQMKSHLSPQMTVVPPPRE